MIWASKLECLGAEVVGSLVEIVGSVEGWVEEAEGVEFRAMWWGGEVFDPPSTVLTVEVCFERFGVGRDICVCDVIGLEEAPWVVPPGKFVGKGQCLLDGNSFGYKGWTFWAAELCHIILNPTDALDVSGERTKLCEEWGGGVEWVMGVDKVPQHVCRPT